MGEGPDIWKEGGKGVSCDMMWLGLPLLWEIFLSQGFHCGHVLHQWWELYIMF